MKLKMKRFMAVLMAFCMMASAMVPVMAADEATSSSQPSNTVEQQLPTQPTESMVQDQTQPASQPTGDDTNSQPQQAQPAAEEKADQPAALAEELAAPTIPGYTLFTGDTINPRLSYIIVAQDQKGDNKGKDVYALYLSQKGLTVGPGSLNYGNNGAVTAKLDLSGDSIGASYLNDNTALQEEDLLLKVESNQDGYTFQNVKSGRYLSMQNAMAATNPSTFTAEKEAGNSWLLSTGGRVVGFNVYGDGSVTANKYTTNATDFWGPKGKESYAIYLYAKNIDAADTTLQIDGYTQMQQADLQNGEYVVAAADQQKIYLLSTTAQTNANEANRDATGSLTDAATALQGANLSLTKTDAGYYLSAVSGDTTYYLGVKDGAVFESSTPQLVQVALQQDGTYTIGNGTTYLSLSNGTYTVGAQAASVQLFRKNAEVKLTQDNIVLEQGYTATVGVTPEASWLYTDAKGVHKAQLQCKVTDGQDVISVENNVIKALQKTGTATVTAALQYGDDYSVDLGSIAVTVTEKVTAPEGTTQEQPFIHGATGGSDYFRIPSLITLDNGWIMAASDIRWKTTADSPQNLDTVVSISKDNGATWNYKVVNYFDDMANTATSQASASFIDPAVIQGEDGTIYMVADACPSYVGLMWGNRMGRESTGFDSQGRLLIAKAKANGDAPTAVSAYTYYVDFNAEPSAVEMNGETLHLYPVVSQDGTQTGTWVDAELDEYTWNGTDNNVSKVMCKQDSGDAMVHNNLFYRQSEWKVYPVFYIMLRTATVQGDGLAWSAPKLLNIKMAQNEAFTGVCPGRGITTTVNGKERIVFAVYDNATGNELASTIYSDDGGATWHRGSHADNLNGTGKSSETQIVRLPDGGLRMYSRNTIGYISYADSHDGGVTWGQYQADKQLAYTSNCMVSFINLNGYVADQQGNMYGNLILASYPKGGSRTDGVIRVGSIDEKTNQVTWLNDATVRYSKSYQYSCLTQNNGNQIGLLYETQNQEWAPGLGHIFYDDFNVTDILGEGWNYLNKAPDTLPTLKLNADKDSLMVGDKLDVSALFSGLSEPATVKWTVQNDQDQQAVTLNKDTTTGTEAVTVTATAPGKATLTASADVELDGVTIKLQASQRLYVSGDDVVTLPDDYDQNQVDASKVRTQKTDTIDDGIYTIYAENGQRILYYAKDSKTTDQVTADKVADGQLVVSSGYDVTRQTWKVTKTDQGYTLESCDQAGKYLNVAQAGNSQLPVSTTPTYFQITPAEGGKQYISATVNGTTYYLNHSGKFGATTQKTANMVFFKEADKYTLNTAGLKAVIADAQELDGTLYTQDSWNALQQAVENGQKLVNATNEYTDQAQAQQAYQQVQKATQTVYVAMKNLQKATQPTPVPPTETPAEQPNEKPTEQPTAQPTVQPTAAPTKAPSNNGQGGSSATATPAPTAVPTAAPTKAPVSNTNNSTKTDGKAKITASEVKKAFDTDATQVELNVAQSPIVDVSAFTLLQKNPEKALRLTGNGYAWNFLGSDIKDAGVVGKQFDASVSLQLKSETTAKIKDFAKEEEFVGFETAYSGNLPGKATLELQLSSQYKGKTMQLYYLPDNGDPQALGEVTVDANGLAQIPLQHASVYFLMAKQDKADAQSTPAPSSSSTTDSSVASQSTQQTDANQATGMPMAIVAAICAVVVIVVAAVVVRLRKRNEQ